VWEREEGKEENKVGGQVQGRERLKVRLKKKEEKGKKDRKRIEREKRKKRESKMGLSQSSSAWSSVRFAHGYQVMRLHEGSPAADAGINAYLDFIVAITPPGGHEPVRFVAEDESFVNIVSKYLEKPLIFHVFNVVDNFVRNVRVTPSERWGGGGSLGMSVKFERIIDFSEFAWRVIKVTPSSPAADAGLEDEVEYFVGTDVSPFLTDDDFDDAIRENVDRTAVFVVYNSKTERTRYVKVKPSYDWGGTGCLGCDIGNGYLHQIPPRKRNIEEGRGAAIRRQMEEAYKPASNLPPALGGGQSNLPPSLAAGPSSTPPQATLPAALGQPATSLPPTLGSGSEGGSSGAPANVVGATGLNTPVLPLPFATPAPSFAAQGGGGSEVAQSGVGEGARGNEEVVVPFAVLNE